MKNNEPKEPLTLGQRLEREAKKRANQLADTFDLRDCLHLESFGIDPEDDDVPTIELLGTYTKRGQNPRIRLDNLTESISEWLREVLPDKIFGELVAEHLSKMEQLEAGEADQLPPEEHRAGAEEIRQLEQEREGPAAS